MYAYGPPVSAIFRQGMYDGERAAASFHSLLSRKSLRGLACFQMSNCCRATGRLE
jgi:hypothetical protein